MAFFKSKPQVEYRILEIEKDHGGLGTSSDIASLANHPGMLALTARMRLQRASLESALKSQRHDSLIDVARLQSGIQWLSWIEKQIQLATRKQDNSTYREPFAQEASELEAIAKALQIVGRNGE